MIALQRKLLSWYRRDGRADLPWRVQRDPYYTVVSEYMLQQTQVDRVVPLFVAFIKAFPTIAALAGASTADVLRMWKGLGYNSRAVRLQAFARVVVRDFEGAIPHQAAVLRGLPGIGPYTAAAIRAFAFDLDDAPIDTNIRRIVHRWFFGLEYPASISNAALALRARELVPSGLAHDWNSALMDLGATLCSARAPKCSRCPVAGSCVAAPIDPVRLENLRRLHRRTPSPGERTKFELSARFARGRIVRYGYGSRPHPRRS